MLCAIDIHGCAPLKRLPAAKPDQVPLGALISRDVANLVAGGKSIGTTHVTNRAYRLHPTEWAIGEAAGAPVGRHRTPAEVYRDERQLRAVQRELLRAGTSAGLVRRRDAGCRSGIGHSDAGGGNVFERDPVGKGGAGHADGPCPDACRICALAGGRGTAGLRGRKGVLYSRRRRCAAGGDGW